MVTTIRLRSDLPSTHDLNPTNVDHPTGAILTFDDTKAAKALLKAKLADALDRHGNVIPAKKPKARKSTRKSSKKSR